MLWLHAVAPSPSPSPSLDVNADSVTPGVVGFIAILLVTVAAVLLILDMTRRIRRVRYRGELTDRREQAEREQDEP